MTLSLLELLIAAKNQIEIMVWGRSKTNIEKCNCVDRRLLCITVLEPLKQGVIICSQPLTEIQETEEKTQILNQDRVLDGSFKWLSIIAIYGTANKGIIVRSWRRHLPIPKS